MNTIRVLAIINHLNILLHTIVTTELQAYAVPSYVDDVSNRLTNTEGPISSFYKKYILTIIEMQKLT